MAPREDVVSSAVAFLQDPSVASSALDKRIAFLQSKNLTHEEIDISLARAGDGSQSADMTQPPRPSQFRPMQQPAAGYGYGYGGYPLGGPWMQQPPEPPRRDWRDWFIMGTVMAGVGYGLSVIAQRYVLPLISPPTPPQLEQDKAYIDDSFNKAFALIDQLSTDTAELKATETERTEKLDTTIKDVDTVIADLKAANTRREAESRIIADQVAGLKDLVPTSLEKWKLNGDARLDDLSQELQSLKKLLENRMGRQPAAATPQSRMPATYTPPPNNPNGVSTSSREQPAGATTEPSAAAPPTPGANAAKDESSSPKRAGGGRAAIPAWQVAASKSGGGSIATSSPSGDGNMSGAGA